MNGLTIRLGIAMAMLSLVLFVGLRPAPAQNAPQFEQQEPATAQPPSFDSQDTTPQQQQQQQPAVRSTGGRYFIDFRSRSALSYGHSFVVFGRTGHKLTRNNVAGLHPRGDSTITYLVGHVLPVDSETGASDGDLDPQYMTASYRIWLTPAQYTAVVRHIRELQASSPAWHAATFNCNAFVGIIAHFVGLSSPPTWLFPEDFINSMRRMNGDQRYASLPGARDAYARAPANRR